MNKQTPRLLFIGIILLWSIYTLFPTFKFNFLSDEEKNDLRVDGKLESLQEKVLKQGLDLQGGMHILLEIDIPTLIENLATNKNTKFYTTLNFTKENYNLNQNFIDEFIRQSESDKLKLNRYFSEISSNGLTIKQTLEKERDDALNRVLEILQNRVDEFGVSEPTIQKQGDQRIIVELAGIQDPARARSLLQSTALLEFSLLKDGSITQNLISRIDKILKGNSDLIDIVNNINEESNNAELNEAKTSNDQEVSMTELFSSFNNDTLISSDSSNGVIIDQDIFQERPFSSLLRNTGNDMGVPEKNLFAIKKIIQMEEIQTSLENEASKISFSKEKETWTLPEGGTESFYKMYHLESNKGLSGGLIQEAKASFYNGQPIVSLSMNSEGAKIWSRLTGANIGKRLAIVLDNNVRMAPTIRSKISDGQTQVEGFANMEEAKDIAIVLRAGALPAPVNIIEERTIGPSLGKDSIEKGTRSVIIGLILILVFMIFYYRGSGFIASTGLIFNLILVLSILSMLDATLTLPGIAGLILTVGMAVDANVIIFERIREELEKGKKSKSAVESGFSRAITTIIDANVTTILAALILYQFGSGPIKGFAIVLCCGILTSMFTAIFTSKTIFNIITNNKNLKSLSI